MKKRRNIAAAIVLSSMMAVSTCAFAVTSMTASAGSITASDEGTYTAYPILIGSVSESSLGNVTFASGFSITSELVSDLKAATEFVSSGTNVFAGISESSSAADFATAISNIPSGAEEKFAKIIGNYFSGTGLTVGSATANIADGYYVIKGGKDATSLNILKVVGTVSITAKEGVPSSAKTVDDKNDSDSTTTLNETGQTSADYDIGDNVPYTLTFTLPSDYARYEKYPITFIDDMCAGLTYNEDAKIWYGTVTGEGTNIAFAADNTATSTTDGTVYKANIADLKKQAGASSLTAGSTITIKYTAKLNNSAVVGGTGNKNKYKVSYSSNPNFVPDTENSTPPEDKTTTEVTNVVFTYKLVVNKKDQNNDPLAQAGFTLYKWAPASPTANPSPVASDTGWVEKEVIAASTATNFEFSGLDDGIYKLVESATPDGYNTIDPVIFTITAEHSDTGITSLSAAGGSLTFTGDKSTGALSVDIVNNQGATLPSTGGIGTTLFYIIGGTLVAGSIVLLITKKRMHSTEE